MKTSLHYLKLMTCTFIILWVISMLNLEAQDYLISFAGEGESTTVATVKVDNLTQGTSLTMNGGDILHLKNVITGIDSYLEDSNQRISFSPNPMIDYSLIKFDLPEDGQTTTSLYDITGRIILQIQDYLDKGQHTYRIQGINNGFYIAKVISNRYSVSGRLLCSGSHKGNPKIIYESTGVIDKKEYDLKGISSETVMQYNAGDRLKLTGISDIYSTVVTDIPTESKTITFNFIACTDGDGNNYPIVQIGTTKGTTNNLDLSEGKSIQIWMAENIKTTKYNDGTAIPNIIDNTAWAALHTGAYSNYSNNPANSTTYGRLYNWFAVDNNAATKVASNGGKNVCPASWHVPTDTEWTTLTTYLGGESVAGNKLKETGTTHWATPNTGATDEAGFKALPSGNRFNNGTFINIGYYFVCWSSTGISTSAWLRSMSSDYSSVYRDNGFNQNGLSVRCLRDF